MEAIAALEKQQAGKLAEEYRRRGYDVVERPSRDQLPAFLAGYHPDLLLRKEGEDEAVVVEVKSRASLAKDPTIRELAGMLRTKPGWRLDLVVVDVGEQLEALEGAYPFALEDIARGVAEAEQLHASGLTEAALLRAWSAVEPTLRLLGEREGLATDRCPPERVLKDAVVNGVVSRSDYEILVQALKHRNAQAHGYIQPEFDPTLTGTLIDTTKALLRLATLESSGAYGADEQTL